MRVSEQGTQFVLRGDLRHSQASLAELTRRVSSGKRFEQLSDGPNEVVAAARWADQQRLLSVYAENAERVQSDLDNADNALQRSSTLLARAVEIVQTARNPVDPTPRHVFAHELDMLREELTALANTKTPDGRALFGGLAKNAVQYVDGTTTFVGDSSRVERKIGTDLLIDVATDGNVVFGFSAGDNVFAVLQRISSTLRANEADPAKSVRSDDIDSLQRRAADVRAGLGSVGVRGETARRAHEVAVDAGLHAQAQRASLEDADIAETITQLKEAQLSYEANLAVLARVPGRTLIDFLA